VSRDAYWRQQRNARPKPRYACPICGAATFSAIPSHLHTHDFRSLDMTTGEIDAFLGKTEPPRDRFGRPMVKTPEGRTKAYTRCTTYVGALEDTYNLGKWMQRMVALGLVMRDDLLLAAGSLTAADKGELDKICDAAREAAAASAGATIGTALHKMCERLDRGEKFMIPGPAKADIKAYQDATKGITWSRIEEFTVHDGLEIGGTPDRIGAAKGQRSRVYDIKTGSIEWGLAKIAMQLAVYARSEAYDVDLGTRSALDVDTHVATIIHLPAGEGRCELVDVDIEQGWEGVQLCTAVRAWRKRKSFAPANLPSLPDLIALADSELALRRLWAEHNHEWDESLTALAKERLAALATAS
jgi:hypothetical protein